MTRRAFFASLAGPPRRFSSDPFPFGIASGDPAPDGVVLWTRLQPRSPGPVPVRWQVAEDEGMSRVVREGTAIARAGLGHAVHVEVRGLSPGRWYWYRFEAGQRDREASPVGRTRTAPSPGATDALRFAVASCQKWQDGYYTAYEHMSREDFDFVVHVGDYIYETRSKPGLPRSHDLPEAVTLEQYRDRYALYKSDPHLQRAHQMFPWVVTWDDHEAADNYAGLIPDTDFPASEFPRRREAAYRAYYEHMPLRAAARLHQGGMHLYRRIGFGATADFHVLDTRQFRSDQPCGDKTKPPCPERVDPARTMLGRHQERWLFDSLAKSRANWNVIAQQVIFAPFDIAPGEAELYSMDKWDGYVAARERILAYFEDQRRRDPRFTPVVLSGDNHNHWAFELRRRAGGDVLGAEFAGTSITSNGDGADVSEEYGGAVRANEHLRFHSSRRGYLRCEVSPGIWQTDYVTFPYVSRPGAAAQVAATFTMERGRPGLVRV